jgi:anion-transporting  ArsA/GET3 family ATPase
MIVRVDRLLLRASRLAQQATAALQIIEETNCVHAGTLPVMPPVLDELFKRRVLWVTGKGGTGKSTMAAALALLAAERGQRTLLIDVEARGDAARFLDDGPPRYQPHMALPNVYHLALQPEEVLDEYLKVSVRMPRLYRIGPVNKVFDFIATAAPGVKEALIAGKVGFEYRAQHWDMIIVDAAPSGQVLSHLRGPRTIQEIVQVGAIRNQTDWVREILEDPKLTAMVVVSLPEEMPVQETAELLQQAPRAVPTPVLAIIANKEIPLPPEGEPLDNDAAKLFAELAENQRPDLERLRSLGPPVVDVPLFGFEEHELHSTRVVADALREQ